MHYDRTDETVAAVYDRRRSRNCDIAGGHCLRLRASALALRRPPLPSHLSFILFSLVVVAVCFANAVPNDFILDDYQIVAVNPAIRTIAPAHLLLTPYWGEKSDAGIYRPLTLFSFALEYPLWHRWAPGYRLVNL